MADNIRIGKVLKEYNIGLGTLVDFLSKKGYTVEANPNAKISAEEFALVENLPKSREPKRSPRW